MRFDDRGVRLRCGIVLLLQGREELCPAFVILALETGN